MSKSNQIDNWLNAQIISPFVDADGAVVGLVINLPPVQTSMRFADIEARMEARWGEIGRELEQLQAWWVNKDTNHGQVNRARYLAEDARLTAERRFLEAMWQQVRSYMPHAEVAQ
ncbi:MAG: hypothetical protein IAE79_07705 [Anaerolinea sp.]|nr:hypothetical protein [Anaerolinea sp.]